VKVGVDTGGTFTDVVALDADGRLHVAKLPSTPRDPAVAVLAGVARTTTIGAPRLRREEGARTAGAVRELVHSTTVGTNALLERRGGPTALICTSGFEDVLALGRQARPHLYALHPVVAPPLVDAAHRLGLDERLAPDGSPLRVPEPAALAALALRVRALEVRSVAVCLLHAYANPAHERAVAAALAPLGLELSLSSEVLPAPREFERTSTTVVDAYVKPVLAAYLGRLAAALPNRARLRVMQSSGGAAGAAEAARRPVTTVLSGPAAGVVGALAVARAAGIGDFVTLDMGGTSTDVALVTGGVAGRVDEGEVAGLSIQLPMLAVHSVGAGGGSIARVDEGGALKVGPESAGADPGPAAYGGGGRLPTVTDADLVLGRLDPARFLGGEMRLDVGRARAAVGALAARLGVSVERAAEDVVAVADAAMARAVRRISVERGHDPAPLALLTFGGAGGLHACAVARELGMTRVVVPPSPGLLCAYGALAAEVTHERVRTLLRQVDGGLDAASLGPELEALERAAAVVLDDEGIPAAERLLERAATLRYRGQSFELEVPCAGDLAAGFHAAHRARYGYALDDRAVELVALRVRARGVGSPPPLPTPASEPGPPEVGRVRAHAEGREWDAPVWARRRLLPGARVDGPALIVEYSATTFVPPGAHAQVLDGGSLEVTLT
jgi:N-methylhydantoinase A